MIEDDDKPIDREAWRRALSRGDDAPPRATDERIRAQARRALAPHTGRWWLPASLAASLLLAVLIVQWQYEAIRAPQVMTESEIAPAARDSAGEAAPVREPEPSVPAAADAVPAAAAAEEGVSSPAAPALRKKSEDSEVSGRRAPLEASAAPQAVAASSVAQRVEASAEQLQTPEAWYEQIEALRAAGRNEEAAAELEKLEAAYPGWLEQHLRQRR